MLRFLDLLVFAAVSARIAQVAWHPVVRRELRDHPRLAAAAAGGVVALLLAVWSLARTFGQGFHLIAAVAAILMGLFAWRARPDFGKRRGLPPGSLGVRASLNAVADRDFYAAAAVRHGPVFKMSQIHQGVVCIMDTTLAHELLMRDTDAIIQVDWPLNRLFPGGYVEFMNGAEHSRYRALFAPGLSSKAIAACEEELRTVVTRVMDASFRAKGPARLDVLPLDLTFPMLARVVLGVRVDDPRVQTLRASIEEIPAFGVHLPVPRRARKAWSTTVDLVTRLARDQAGHATTGGSVVASVLAASPAALDDPVVVGNLVAMIKDGHEIIAGQLRWMLRALARDPEWVSSLRTAGQPHVDHQVASFANEALRLWSSRYVYRRVVRETRVGDYRIPPGWLIRICYDRAHDDAAVYPSPHDFVAGRFLAGTPPPGSYCPLGHGAHACLGGDLTLLISRVVLREVALRYDLQVVQDGPPERPNRHWAIWQPSSRLRIAFTTSDRHAASA